MKIFAAAVTLLSLSLTASACCWAGHDDGHPACNAHGALCPRHWACVFKSTANPTWGKCYPQYVIDYNAADRAFSGANHNSGATYKALHGLVPGASAKLLNDIIKNHAHSSYVYSKRYVRSDGKGNRYHTVNARVKGQAQHTTYNDFVDMYRVLVDKTRHQGAGDFNKCHNTPCTSNQICYDVTIDLLNAPHQHAVPHCGRGKGYCCETVHTAAPTSLTHSERARVNNVYTALNGRTRTTARYQDQELALTQFSGFFMNVCRALHTLNTAKCQSISNQADTNHDRYIDYLEFLQACQTFKSKHARSFPKFLQLATAITPLTNGDACAKYTRLGDKECSPGYSCKRTRVLLQYNNKKNDKGVIRTYSSYGYFCVLDVVVVHG